MHDNFDTPDNVVGIYPIAMQMRFKPNGHLEDLLFETMSDNMRRQIGQRGLFLFTSHSQPGMAYGNDKLTKDTARAETELTHFCALARQRSHLPLAGYVGVERTKDSARLHLAIRLSPFLVSVLQHSESLDNDFVEGLSVRVTTPPVDLSRKEAINSLGRSIYSDTRPNFHALSSDISLGVTDARLKVRDK